MADFGIGEATAAAGILSTLATLTKTVYDISNQPSVGGVPKPPPAPSTTAPTSPMGTVLPPGERYNKPPATTGANQPFLASLVPDQASDSNLDVLSQIRRTLG